MNWIKKEDWNHPGDASRYTLEAAKKVARNYDVEDGVEISARWNFNGSGPRGFGGAAKWPVALLRVSFEEGQVEERDAFVGALQKFLDSYFSK